MNIGELSRIQRSIEIGAPPERVWKALTTASEIAAWFRVRVEGKVAPGAEVWMESTQPGHAGMRFLVRFLEMTRPRRFVWEWHPGAVDAKVDYSREPWTTVTFTLEATTAGTRLTVTETGFDAISLERRAKVFEDNSQGWTIVVSWIKEYVEAAAR